MGRAGCDCDDGGPDGEVQTGPKRKENSPSFYFLFLFPLIFSVSLFAKFKYILDFQIQIRCIIKNSACDAVFIYFIYSSI